MGKKLVRKITKFWPIFILVGLELALFWQNYAPGTFFLGWDNLFAEINFGVSFERSFFSVWQEYRGLGLLDGMSFAANLPHYLFIWLLSFVLPLALLRYFFFFLMHLVGAIGVYKLLNSYFKKSKVISLLGALFYQYNLGAIQMFYAPYELFAAHFAFLPWVFYYALQFLYNAGKRNLALFALFSFFAVPQAHVSTIFLVFAFALAILFVFYLFEESKPGVKRALTLLALTFCINAYWGLPFAYNVLVNKETATDAKINIMATDDIYLLSKKYGDLEDVAQIKSSMFDSVNIWADGQKEAMLMRWQEYVEEPFFQAFAYFFFLLAVVGMVKSAKEKDRKYYPFIIMFLFGFLMLGLGVLIFERFALFKQIFRFTFTKFSILYFFVLSIFLAVGVQFLVEHFKKERTIALLFGMALFIYSFPSFQGYFLYPRLKLQIPQEYFKTVEFFNKQEASERIALLPQPSFWGWTQNRWGYKGSGFFWYGLPQATMDGAFYPWSANNENYYWEITQAINREDVNLFQTVLDKYNIKWVVFDESVIYQESPGAIDYEAIARLLDKSSALILKKRLGEILVYKVNLEREIEKYVYLAQDLPEVNSYKWGDYDRAYAEYGDYYSRLASGSRGASAGRVFNAGGSKESHNDSQSQDKNNSELENNDKITHVNLLPTTRDSHQLNSQLTIAPITPENTINSLFLSNSETRGVNTKTPKNTWPALSNMLAKRNNSSELNTGFLGDSTTNNGIYTNNNIYYPFRSLFSGRGSNDFDYKISSRLKAQGSRQDDEYFVFKTQIPKELAGGELVFPAIEKEEISAREKDDVTKRKFELPQVYIDGELAPLSSRKIRLSYINKGNFVVRVPKIGGYYSYDSGYLQSQEIDRIYLPNLKHEIAYLISIKTKNISGRPFKFWIENLTSKRADMEVFLEKEPKPRWEYFIQPPMAEDGIGYTLHFDNEPIGDERRINELGRVTVNPIPYRFLTGIKIVKDNQVISQKDKHMFKEVRNNIKVEHPNPSLYKIKINNEAIGQLHNTTLVLSQAYDKGWTAFEVKSQKSKVKNWLIRALPFIFGEQVVSPSASSGSRHVLVNNWANGWNIPDSRFMNHDSRIIIVYLPQYLQYFGFLLLIITPLIVVKLGDGRV